MLTKRTWMRTDVVDVRTAVGAEWDEMEPEALLRRELLQHVPRTHAQNECDAGVEERGHPLLNIGDGMCGGRARASVVVCVVAPAKVAR